MFTKFKAAHEFRNSGQVQHYDPGSTSADDRTYVRVVTEVLGRSKSQFKDAKQGVTPEMLQKKYVDMPNSSGKMEKKILRQKKTKTK